MIVIRPAVEADLDAVVRLCAEHAAYERSTFDLGGLRRSLLGHLFDETPRARCLIVELSMADAVIQ
jgi:hypothetical protein